MNATSTAARKGIKKALLIGAADYNHPDACPNLLAPVTDVNELKKVLELPESGFECVHTLVNPTKGDFVQAVEVMLGMAAEDDTVLIYYSGHGKIPGASLLLCTRETALMPEDPNQRIVTSTCVAVSDIKNFVTTTKAKLIILIFDCCYAGKAAASFKGGDVSAHIWEELERPRGTYLITSSTATQPSLEKAGDTNSLFTKWLVRGLVNLAADDDNDGIIHLKDLFEYVKVNVGKENPKQSPQFQSYQSIEVPVEIARRVNLAIPAGDDRTEKIPYLRAVQDVVDNKRAIFFLGDGIYGDGPLSSRQIIEAISTETECQMPGEHCLPTAAEHLQRYLDDIRGSFLHDFGEILAQREKQTEQPAIHQMLARMDAPWLAVSTTHDMLLEHYLEDQGVPFVVVTHILQEIRGDDEIVPSGKILIMRRGPEQKTEIVAADSLPDLSADRVIYKVLGSPRFFGWHKPPDGVDNKTLLDTVIATESDHITFVGNLRHEKTRIPSAFSLPFQKRTVVFLGYNLDTWHYRIVATIFGTMLPMSGAREPYAVRVPKSQIEDLFWARLRARMIPIEPEKFIRRLQQVAKAED